MRGSPPARPPGHRPFAVLGPWILALCIGHPPVCAAAPPTTTQIEIEHLLTYVGASRCDFYRNGSWYTAMQAEAHLREKLGLLNAGNQIQSAEEFIDKVATASAFTKLPYQVRCGAAPAAVNGWLLQELRRFRRCNKNTPCASRDHHAAPGMLRASLPSTISRRGAP